MKQYIKPQIQFITIEDKDVIATSFQYYDGEDGWSRYGDDAL